MDPPMSFPASPGMPLFSVSPERVKGTKPKYDGHESVPQSPSLPSFSGRMSPLKNLRHRRNDSDASIVSVHELTSKFECLEVTDVREAQEQFKKTLEKVKGRNTAAINDLQKKHDLQLQREQMAREDLAQQLGRAEEEAKEELKGLREDYAKRKDEFKKEQRKMETWLQEQRAKRKNVEAQNGKLERRIHELQTERNRFKEEHHKAQKECLQLSRKIPDLQTQNRSLQISLDATKVNLTTARDKAENYQHEAHTLEVQLQTNQMRFEEDLKKMQEQIKLVEEERDALKTSLKEEEVLRMAAEGRLALPPASAGEADEFSSPKKSPQKSLLLDMDGEDKENVTPKRTSEFKTLQQELRAERRLRERADEQIEFMKLECQFQCCSCRIADSKGSKFVHDGSYTIEMERIKASIPILTPPASDHGDAMEGVVIKQEEQLEGEYPLTPPEEPVIEPIEEPAKEPEPVLKFSPTSGTFRSISSSSPAKEDSIPEPKAATPPPVTRTFPLSSITEASLESSPWAPPPEQSMIRTSTTSPPPYRPQHQAQSQLKYENVPEEAVADDDENDENATPLPSEPQTPLHGPFHALTPSNYLTKTITTTTTIPLHFSPATPAAAKDPRQPPTPSTIGHMPTHAQSSQPLGDLTLNKLPIDREAALEQIRQRRGRARSIAAGQSTPRKQMMEGVGLAGRRDISAPVARVRR